MFIKVEGERLVNLDLVEVVELYHSKRLASAYCGGAVTVPDSHILYLHFTGIELEKTPEEPKE